MLLFLLGGFGGVRYFSFFAILLPLLFYHVALCFQRSEKKDWHFAWQKKAWDSRADKKTENKSDRFCFFV